MKRRATHSQSEEDIFGDLGTETEFKIEVSTQVIKLVS